MKFLVAGAGGFIGGHLVNYLNEQGHKIVCADIKPLENWFNLNEKIRNKYIIKGIKYLSS